MKRLTLNSFVAIGTLICLTILSSSCRRVDLLQDPITEQSLEGVWRMSSVPNNVPPPGFPISESKITLKADGIFIAERFPLVKASSSSDVTYINGKGTWKLQEVSNSNTFARWELVLNFPSAMYGLSWDILGTAESPVLFGLTDLDYWIGFKFVRLNEPQANQQP